MPPNFSPDPAVELVELLADPFAGGGETAPELPPGFAAGPGREEERHGRADDRADQEAEAKAGARGSGLFGLLSSVHTGRS